MLAQNRLTRALKYQAIGLVTLCVISLKTAYADYVGQSESLPDASIQAIEQAFSHCDVDTLSQYYQHHADAIIQLKNDAQHERQDINKNAYYYAGFSAYRLSAALIQLDQTKKAKGILKKSIKLNKKALKKYTDDSAFYVLAGSLSGLQIAASPLTAIWKGRGAQKKIKQALKLAPKNPRALMVKGVAEYQSAAFLLGSKKDALMLLESALTNLQNTPQWPYWGEVDILLWLGRLAQDKGEQEKAMDYFTQALSASPQNCWVQKAMDGAGFMVE